MSHVEPLRLNLGNSHSREHASVATCLAEALPALLLEHPQLRTACLTVDDAKDLCPGDEGRTRNDVTCILLDEQNLLEREGGSLLSRRAVDLDDGAGGDLQLPAVGLNDRVHARTSV